MEATDLHAIVYQLKLLGERQELHFLAALLAVQVSFASGSETHMSGHVQL
jgi:hypothetical protein